MSQLKLISWNIAGWKSKANNGDFLKFILNFDIILFQESWVPDSINISDFQSFVLPAYRLSKKGRFKSGLAILIKSAYKPELVTTTQNQCSLIAVKLSFKGLLLVIINAYLPPSSSTNQRFQQWEQLTAFMEKIETMFPSAHLLLGADLNARVGKNGDIYTEALEADLVDQFPHICSYQRSSKDNSVNEAGVLLTRLSIQFNLIWLNGLNCFNNASEYTFISPAGCSVIDYILISTSLLHRVVEFSISEFKISDHLPLTLLLELDTPSQHPSTTPQCGKLMLSTFKWNSSSLSKVQSIVKSPRCQILNSRLHLDKNPLNFIKTFEETISYIVIKVAPPPNHSKAKNLQISPRWFDKECLYLKSIAREYFRLFRASNSSETLQSYFVANAHLKDAINRKRTSFMRAQWEMLIRATKQKDSKSFWKIVNGASKTELRTLRTISNLCWTRHFSNLFYDKAIPFSPGPISNEILRPDWAPVSPALVKEMILSLKSGKAAGPDAVPVDWLKADVDWWAPILSDLYVSVNRTGVIPGSWLKSIKVPIYKKGDPSLPDNFRPISLLSVVGKLYAKILLMFLNQWISQEKILGAEQIGFRKDRTTLDHCLILSHLIHKYALKTKSKMYVAFLDLKSAFDSVDRNLLWSKLAQLGIDSKLLFLIQRLYTNTSCQVKTSSEGHLTDNIPTNKGVKQGGLLAPTLFNLFLNDLASFLAPVESHSPKLGSRRVQLLLYADDAILISRSRIGLRRLMDSGIHYLRLNKLQLNYAKSKIMVFSNSWKPLTWKFENHMIEQVKSFKYLGLHFSYNLAWSLHRNKTIASAKTSSHAITRFFYHKGGRFVPPALKVFNAKIRAQILYGIPLWISSFNYSVEQLQATFLRKILGVPNCVPYSALCLETGQSLISTQAWLRVSNFWLKVYFNHELTNAQHNLLDYLLEDSHVAFQYWEAKMKSIGVWSDLLCSITRAEAFRIIRTRLLDIQIQNLKNLANKRCSPLFLHLPVSHDKVPDYLFQLDNPHLRRAFTLARCNVLPSAVLQGRFNGIPMRERLCPCSSGAVESIDHIFFCCSLHAEARNKFLTPFLSETTCSSDNSVLKQLLSTPDPFLMRQTAIFVSAVLKTNLER